MVIREELPRVRNSRYKCSCPGAQRRLLCLEDAGLGAEAQTISQWDCPRNFLGLKKKGQPPGAELLKGMLYLVPSGIPVYLVLRFTQ